MWVQSSGGGSVGFDAGGARAFAGLVASGCGALAATAAGGPALQLLARSFSVGSSTGASAASLGAGASSGTGASSVAPFGAPVSGLDGDGFRGGGGADST